MQELIDRLTSKAGLSSDQAAKSLDTIKEFVKEKFPMLAGAVDNMFSPPVDNIAAQSATDTTKQEEHNIMDKISDVIPGQAGKKAEEIAKNVAHKAEEVFDDLKDKLSGLMGGDKK